MPRYHVRRILTGKWLSRDLTVREGAVSRTLSGPGVITGAVDLAEAGRIQADGLPLLHRWSTAIYREADSGRLDAGICGRFGRSAGLLAFEAPGFTRYPQGIPFDGTKGFGVRADPTDVFRFLWQNVQGYSNANLGVTVDATKSTATVGTNEQPYGLTWWETTDIGGEMDNLARLTPFDYEERHRWLADDKAVPACNLTLGVPRLGRLRPDLRFVEGENIRLPVDLDEDDFANGVMGVGKGEGSKAIRDAVQVLDSRLRRPRVFTDKTADAERLRALLSDQLARFNQDDNVSQVAVVDHRNARISQIALGDDIDLRLYSVVRDPLGVAVRARVTGIDESDADGQVVLNVARSSSFTYNLTFTEGVEYQSA